MSQVIISSGVGLISILVIILAMFTLLSNRPMKCNICGRYRWHTQGGIQEFETTRLALWNCDTCGATKSKRVRP